MGQSSSSPSKRNLSEESKKIEQEVREHPVVIYTKDGCGYCVRAKNELYDAGVNYTEKNLNTLAKINPDDIQNYVQGLMDYSQQKTVPQIFICGKFIGGYTELNAMRPNLLKFLETCSVDRGETMKKDLSKM